MSDVLQSAAKAGQKAKTRAETMKDEVSEELARGKAGIEDETSAARDALSHDLHKLQQDMAAIQKTMMKFTSEAGGEAARTARNVGSTVASHAGDIAEGAKERAGALTSDLEDVARRNPVATIGAALVAGVAIGLLTRSRH